jgi:hypothetical protein
MTTVFAVAEIGMDETSTRLLAERRELGFFERESLAKLVLDQLNAFRQGLPKMDVPWQLSIIRVHVHADTGRMGNAGSRIRVDRFCILKGDLTSKYRGADTRVDKDREGVLVVWLEEHPDKVKGQQLGKETRSGAPRTTPAKVSAMISLTLIAFNKGQFSDRTREIHVRHKGEQRWELIGR